MPCFTFYFICAVKNVKAQYMGTPRPLVLAWDWKIKRLPAVSQQAFQLNSSVNTDSEPPSRVREGRLANQSCKVQSISPVVHFIIKWVGQQSSLGRYGSSIDASQFKRCCYSAKTRHSVINSLQACVLMSCVNTFLCRLSPTGCKSPF